MVIKKIFLFIFLSFFSIAQSNYYGAKGTNLSILIDGDSSDVAWKNATWQPIDKFWIPYNNSLTNGFPTEGGKLWTGATDFTGKYKILWSSKLNKLVILIDIKDDVFIDCYPGGGWGYTNFDLPEIFIDEDNSKTKHLYEANSPFENAESAFAYHLAASKPTVGGVTKLVSAMDIGGRKTDSQVLNYAWHFPQFALKNLGNNHYIYEMTLTVFNDTYPADFETYTSQLQAGKILGFAINYCDNDANDAGRDHFISSVTVAGADNNIAWQTSSVFGILELLPEPNSVSGFDTLSVKFDNIVLTWNSTIHNFTASGFHVFQNNTWVGSTTGNTITVSGLNQQTLYTFNVAAFNQLEVSNASQTKTITTNRNLYKGLVNELDTSFVSHQSVGLIWNATVANFTAKGFNIYQNEVKIGTTSGNSFTILGLNAATNYVFKIIAFDKFGNNSVASFPKTVTTKSVSNAVLEVETKSDFFTILPNPTHGFLEILNPLQVSFETTIYNKYGQKVKTISKNESTILINIENLSNGVYFLHIHTQNGIFIRRFLKI